MVRMVMGCLLGVVVSGGLSAQTLQLAEPEAIYPDAFSVVQTVRELPDGRVLVADPLEQAFVVLDLDEGSLETLGRVGQGPREYRQPDAIWALPGGESLLVDLGNGRLTRIGSDLSFGETMPYTIGETGMGLDLVLAIPSGVDAEGALYFRSFGRLGAGVGSRDSVAVLRFDLDGTDVDTVTMVGVGATTRQESGSANNRNVSVVPIPLSPADAWGVAPDGSVVVARSADYSIEWHRTDGSVVRGPANQFDPITIRQADKEEWDNERSVAGGGMALQVQMNNGSMSMSATRGGRQTNGPDLDQYEWPDAKPAFYGARVNVDGQGRAWVRKHLRAGTPVTYDVFDALGRVEATVSFPEGRRLVSFGESGLYAVRIDEFGLQYLERYANPLS